MSVLRPVAVLLGLAVLTAAARADFEYRSITAVGEAGDSVQGVRIRPDGTMVVAANVRSGPFVDRAAELGKGDGVIALLSADGTKLLASARVAGKVRDLALDGDDNLYVAADADGLIKLDAKATKVLWKKDVGGPCCRVDAGRDGHCAALRYDRDNDSTPGESQVVVFDPQGKELGRFKGHRNTLDVCVDAASKTVVLVGWRQANAFDGKKKEPVQISYVRGCGYDGGVKYTLYDWSTDPEAADFINKPTNNMADTRGYRCCIGQDGLLYCGFECAGGNHIFRYEPRLDGDKWVDAGPKKAKGDQYHNFANSRAEHKLFVGRYEPGTGKYLAGQEFCGRLGNGRANAVRLKNGDIAATADGAVLAVGAAPSGLPISLWPPDSGDYSGGGFALLLRPGLKERALCTRVQADASAHAGDARKVGDKLIVVVGGSASAKADNPLRTLHAVQPQAVPGGGFLAVLAEK